MKGYMCMHCHFVFDEEAGDLESGVEPATPWDEMPPSWCCPNCGVAKDDFEVVEI